MRFKAFKNFSIGKSRNKNKKDEPKAEDSPTPEITEIKDETAVKTAGVEKAGVENADAHLQELSRKAGIILEADDISTRPHGPAGELTIEPEDAELNDGLTLDEVDSDATKLGEEIKISEVSAEKAAALKATPDAAAAPQAAEKPEEKPDEKKEDKPDENDSLDNLFNSQEEDENPLASLINSLPDVTVQELMDDLDEIKRIIREWKPISK